ncbi:MAG: hypothetical protein U0790_12230 [Isosphaeraceae bacterium]
MNVRGFAARIRRVEEAQSRHRGSSDLEFIRDYLAGLDDDGPGVGSGPDLDAPLRDQKTGLWSLLAHFIRDDLGLREDWEEHHGRKIDLAELPRQREDAGQWRLASRRVTPY